MLTTEVDAGGWGLPRACKHAYQKVDAGGRGFPRACRHASSGYAYRIKEVYIYAGCHPKKNERWQICSAYGAAFPPRHATGQGAVAAAAAAASSSKQQQATTSSSSSNKQQQQQAAASNKQQQQAAGSNNK